jgi:hypothetical protein
MFQSHTNRHFNQVGWYNQLLHVCFSNNKAIINPSDPLTLGFALEIKQDSGENRRNRDFLDMILEDIEFS